jgi:hypothetical protein
MRRAVVLIIVSVLVFANQLHAQPWPLYTGSFLEPTQFTIVKSMTDRTLRLQMGYGSDIAGSQMIRVGLEGLVWSRLRALPDFRFPVETADYFFGIYSRFSISPDDSTHPWRFRVSHISSHLVDGTADTTIGGSSSHFSREFLTLEHLGDFDIFGLPVNASFGLRYVFHQITQAEASIQFPLVIELNVLKLVAPSWAADHKHAVLIGFGSANDPSGSSTSASLTLRNSFAAGTFSDLFFTWRHGPSVSGNYAAEIGDQFEIGLRIEPEF